MKYIQSLSLKINVLRFFLLYIVIIFIIPTMFISAGYTDIASIILLIILGTLPISYLIFTFKYKGWKYKFLYFLITSIVLLFFTNFIYKISMLYLFPPTNYGYINNDQVPEIFKK